MSFGGSPESAKRPTIHDDVGALANDIGARMTPKSPLIVGVDGFADAGKTTLAKALGARIKAVTFHTDCYVTRQIEDGARSYLDCVSGGLPKLRTAIRTAKGVAPAIIIEGICLADTVKAAGIDLDVMIYVRHESAQHRGDELRWEDEDELERYRAENAPMLSLMSDWVLQYHLKQRPHEIADYVFRRIRYEFI